jgi:hypothetical protein
VAYFRALDAASDRVMLVEAGKSTRGLPMMYAVISSPQNLARFEHYKEVSRRLADSRGLTDAQARELARDSKVIVHIDGGMHSSEAADHQLPIALAHTLASAQGDPQIDATLDNVILVLWPTLNPDGQNMIVDWYRKNLRTEYEVSPMPWLYQEYVGHDNNRDGYMANMIESQVVTRAQQDYSPAIFYSQHQKAPFPARIWMPPFGEPISSNIHPLMRHWTTMVGMNIMAAFENQRLPGAMAQGRFDNWYAGFLDYTHVFRHTISFFTETALHEYATPYFYEVKNFPKNTQDLKAQVMYPSPWEGGWWRLADAVKYMEVSSMAVLDTAAKYRETLQYNRYQAGRDTIRQHQTQAPYAYILPGVQDDAPEAGLLAQKMIDQGLEVHRATRTLRANGKDYPAGSWVILLDQPFAGLARELFDVQRYPDAVMDGSGKPVDLPYDVTGWTLPMQMGVMVDVASEPVSAAQRSSLQLLKKVELPPGEIKGKGSYYVLSHQTNASLHALNDALAAGATAAIATESVQTAAGTETGAIVIGGIGQDAMLSVAREHSLQVKAVSTPPKGTAVSAARIGLYRPWKPSIDEGWTRWLLEQYDFPYTSLHNEDIRKGGLNAQFDVIVFAQQSKNGILNGNRGAWVRPEYRGGLGEEGSRAIEQFVRSGGTVVTLDEAADFAIDALGLPVRNTLRDVPRERFYCPGAILEIFVDNEHPLGYGIPSRTSAYFLNSPAFELTAPFTTSTARAVAKYPATNALQSGWIGGPEYLFDRVAVAEVAYGKGRVVLLGFRAQFRAQPQATFKLLFNALHWPAVEKK